MPSEPSRDDLVTQLENITKERNNFWKFYTDTRAELQAARDSIQRVLRLAKDIEVGEMTSVVMTAERRREWADEIRSTIETIPEDLQGCCPCENPSHHIEGCRYQHQLQAAREENETLRDAVCGTCGRSLAPDGDCFGCSYDRAQAEIERLGSLRGNVLLQRDVERLEREIERLKGQLTAQHAEIMDALAETKRQLERNRELESEIERLKAFLMTFHIGKPLTSDDAVPAAIDVIIALRQEIERLKRDHINQMTELRFFERRLKERQPPS